MAMACVGSLYGQRETPAGAGDRNLADDGIKARSVEMERIKREAAKAEAASFAPINRDIMARFPEIKEDFENIQIFESNIIKSYTTGKTIDYVQIAASANAMNKSAKRLDLNLFADTKKEKQSERPKKDPEKAPSVRDLIIDLDAAVGSFVTSKIFGNIKVVEPEVAIKTRTDLLNILRLSDLLAAEAGKMK
jgi:hypothetical protein